MSHDDVGYKRKPQRSRCQRICRAIYNPDKGEFFGRSCGSWAKIGLFYLIFYSCLAGFFAVAMYGFFQTLDDKHPTMTEMYSLIKQNPGMGFRPLEEFASTLIKVNTSEESSYSGKIQNMLTYLRENGYIDNENKFSTITEDSNGKPVFDLSSQDAACRIDIDDINNSFGYRAGQPCVLLKINKIWNWEPKMFDNESLETDHGKEAKAALQDRLSFEDIGVSCEGESDGDVDNLGTVEYFPRTGFPKIYYPYLNADNYRPPLVFAKFMNPKPGALLQIWCKMWAANVKIHKNDKAGSTRFELMVDIKKPSTP